MEPFLVCQKKFWQKDPNLPLPLSFGVSKFFGQAKCNKKNCSFAMMHLACQKNLETPKLSGNGRLGSFLPLPLSFDVANFFWQAKCIIAKEQFFLLHLACQKNLETPKLSGNGRLGSFVKIFSGRPRMAP
ncbi:unnamed protein product [Blepharisma stoltei]|uniref:Uncharacterized protein n=1 Tax=Blepharisma stoltei TaxID=1481888 RepID=A0AAU9KB47_9CILI|nr:unnamed protein product [Blepharisma stoltei]